MEFPSCYGEVWIQASAHFRGGRGINRSVNGKTVCFAIQSLYNGKRKTEITNSITAAEICWRATKLASNHHPQRLVTLSNQEKKGAQLIISGRKKVTREDPQEIEKVFRKGLKSIGKGGCREHSGRKGRQESLMKRKEM